MTHKLSFGGERRRPSTPPLLINLGVAAAHTAWSSSQGIGLVGWIDTLQPAFLGSQDRVLSLALCFGISWALLALLGETWGRWRARRSAVAGLPTWRARSKQSRLVGIWAVLMALTWALGVGLWAWEHGRSRFAASGDGDFVPTLASASAPNARYLALSGQLRPDLVVEHREGGERTGFLVPVMAQEPAPLRYAVLMNELPSPHAEPAVLLVEGLGPLPAPAAAAWARAGHAVADDARLLAPVQSGPSRAQREARARAELQTVVIVCALVGAGFTFALLMQALLRRRRRGRRFGS